MFPCVFATFPYGVLWQLWFSIVSIPDLKLAPYAENFFFHLGHACLIERE